jgi:spermidine synthase
MGHRWLLPVLACLFLATGISGLMYQVLWLRILALTFGVTVYAISTVLGSFMAGLGLGSFLAGRIVDRVRNPLATYGVAEVFVGLLGASTIVGFELVHVLYVGLVTHLPGDSVLIVSILRALLTFVILLIPTSLMGATLPIIIKSSLLRAEGLSGNISILYAVNTLGAAGGAFFAGFFLIGSVGIQTAILIAATINMVAGLGAFGVSRLLPGSTEMHPGLTET